MGRRLPSMPSTSRRHRMAFVVGFFYFLATLFLLLVNIGQVANQNIINDWYFFRFDVSNIVPSSVPEATLVNSIATSIGLHDYYDVGMWNYCEGYYSSGITSCSQPTLLYWFDPVAILSSQLLSGARIQLPAEITNYLTILQLASQVMFVGFFAAVIACFVATVLAPFAVYSKGWTVPLGLLGWLATLLALLASGISTGMWTIFSSKLQEFASEINIIPSLGYKMFVFQWLGTACALVAAILQTGLCCCGTSRREAKRRSMMSGSNEMVDA